MSKIFISYRRSDSADITGRIYDHLVEYFGKDHLFKDVEAIPLGADFRASIQDAVQSCNVFLVIIGKQWLHVTDDVGNRRLDDPQDYVRIEIEAALERNILIIPVLVGGSVMPPAELMPSSLKPLVFRNALPVRADPDFRNDIRRLRNTLGELIQKRSLSYRFRPSSLISAISILIVAAIVSLVVWQLMSDNETHGKGIVAGTFSIDLDRGDPDFWEQLTGPSETDDSDADFYWEQITETERYLVPINGARSALMGQINFDSITHDGLLKLTYSADKIDGSENNNYIPEGTVIGYKTNQGRYGKFIIDSYGYYLEIQWVTYSR